MPQSIGFEICHLNDHPLSLFNVIYQDNNMLFGVRRIFVQVKMKFSLYEIFILPFA